MINVATIMEQMLQWLRSDPELRGYVVSRSEPVNEDAKVAVNGWVGLYRRTVDYDPRNLGTPPNNYEADLMFVALVQRAHLRSGKDCEDALEESVRKVLRRMVQVPRTHIDTFTDLSVDYTYIESDRTTMFFQGALLTLTARVSEDVQ